MKEILPTPQQMIEHLDIYVHGQTEAKRSITKAVYFHYLNLILSAEGQKRIPAEHSIIVGPTGSGKTLIAKTLGEFLGIPMFFADASSLSATGYVGDSVGNLLSRFQSFCGDRFKMERAIIFIDEIDKIAIKQGSGIDVRGEMVQQELLTVLDGNVLRRDRGGEGTPSYHLDTRKILIIAAGAFDGIQKIIEKRTGAFGFGSASSEKDAGEKQAEADDIAKYGFLPEFIARFPNIINLNKLTEADFRKILSQPDQSPITERQRLFKLHGIELKFDDDALDEISKRASKSPNGARGLRQQVIKCLEDLEWQLTTLWEKGCREVLVGAETVRGEAEPRLIFGERTSEPAVLKMREVAFMPETAPEKTVQEHQSAAETETNENNEVLQLESLKAKIGWAEAKGSAQKWWRAFESENENKLWLVIKLAEELLSRKATITEFFMVYVYSDTDNIKANLHYLDFVRSSNKQSSGDLGSVAPDSLEAGHEEAREAISYERCSSRGKVLWEWTERCFSGSTPLLEYTKQLKDREILTADAYFEAGSMALSLSPQAILDYSSFIVPKVNERRHLAQNDFTIGKDCFDYFDLNNSETPVGRSLNKAESYLLQLRNLSRQIFLSKILKADELLNKKYAKDWAVSGFKENSDWHPHDILELPIKEWDGSLFNESLNNWRIALKFYLGERDPMSFCKIAVAQLALPFLEEIEHNPAMEVVARCEDLSKGLQYKVHEKDVLGVFLSYLASSVKARGSEKLDKALKSLGPTYKIAVDVWDVLRKKAESN